MGSGKSSVGQLLARRYGWPRFDTDEMVEKELGMSIVEIFKQCGEARFRDAETTVLNKLDAKGNAIVVTGGGIVLRPQNVERLREVGMVVSLTADLEILQQRLSRRQDRPLLQTKNPKEAIAMLFAQRKNLYEKAADFVVDTTRLSYEEVVKAIRDELQITG